MVAVPKPIRRRDPKYLEWIRTQRCCITNVWAENDLARIEAHHVREEGQGGTGTKPDDSRAVPLQSWLHRLYHDIGRREFETRFAIDLETEIKRLNALYLRENPPKVKREYPAKTQKEVRREELEKQVKRLRQQLRKAEDLLALESR